MKKSTAPKKKAVPFQPAPVLKGMTILQRQGKSAPLVVEEEEPQTIIKKPKKKKVRSPNYVGGHLNSCRLCGFTLVTDEDKVCPRCEAPAGKAQPEAVLVDCMSETYGRWCMSYKDMALANLSSPPGLHWRYVAAPDQKLYRKWLRKFGGTGKKHGKKIRVQKKG